MSLLEDRMRDPVHVGRLKGATGVGRVGNPACGDVVTVYLRCEPATPDGIVVAASFESLGSAHQLATVSILIDCILGGTVQDARERTPNCILGKLPDLPSNRRYLARLALDALARALDDQERRLRPGEPAEPEARVMDEGEARTFVLGLLQNGRHWGTKEIDAMAHAEGVAFPHGTARCLGTLRRQGDIEGEMDVAGRAWRWWVA